MIESKVSVRGIEMFSRRQGKGPALVFVHGNTGSSLWFSKVMDIPGYLTIAPDLPNFGDSDHIETADIDVYADYLKAWMDAEKIEHAAVLGHSLGGAVSISLALRYPGTVSRLILVDSAPPSGFLTPESHYPIIEQYKTNRGLMKMSLRAVAPTMEDEKFLETLTDTAMRMNPIAFIGNAQTLSRFNYAGKGGNFKAPVLVVVGEKDILITERMGRETAEDFPNGEFQLLPDVGHSVMVENPALFRKVVTDFLRK